MGQTVAGICTAPTELVDSDKKTTNYKAKLLRELPIDLGASQQNHFTNRITLRPDEVVEALQNPPFWEAENQGQEQR